MIDVFEFDNYKEFLKEKIRESSKQHGYKATLARAAHVPQALFSQVLHTKKDLSVDHGLKLALFWGLTEEETLHWLEMVQLGRATSKELQAHLRSRLAARKKKRADLASRFNQPRVGATEQEWIYSTQWMLQALHFLATIPAFRTSAAMARALELPTGITESGLAELERMGIIERETATTWRAKLTSVHLPRSSYAGPIHHWIWRQKAMEYVHQHRDDDLFYTTLHTLSVQDARKMRSMLLECIERTRALVHPSPEETLVGFNLDFYHLIR